VGLALAGEAALVFLGTGSVSYGAFHEALQLAAARSLPVTFLVSWWVNDGPFGPQLAVPPARLAEAVGLAATVVDGMDEAAVRAAVGAGVALVQAELRGTA
jgi:TPP-dependent pyruvate/acetoin dehydrogenase alpha subunit